MLLEAALEKDCLGNSCIAPGIVDVESEPELGARAADLVGEVEIAHGGTRAFFLQRGGEPGGVDFLQVEGKRKGEAVFTPPASSP